MFGFVGVIWFACFNVICVCDSLVMIVLIVLIAWLVWRSLAVCVLVGVLCWI